MFVGIEIVLSLNILLLQKRDNVLIVIIFFYSYRSKQLFKCFFFFFLSIMLFHTICINAIGTYLHYYVQQNHHVRKPLERTVVCMVVGQQMSFVSSHPINNVQEQCTNCKRARYREIGGHENGQARDMKLKSGNGFKNTN